MPFWSCRLCPRLCSPSNGNLCTFATSLSLCGALLTVLHKLGRSSSTFMVSLVQSWQLLVATSFRYPAKFTVRLAPKLTSPFHRVKYKSFPREWIPSVVSSNRSFRPRNWVKVTLLRSLANSVSLQDNCLVDLDACILCRPNCVNTGKNGSSHLTPEIERAIGFWLSVLPSWPVSGSSAAFWHTVCHYDE